MAKFIKPVLIAVGITWTIIILVLGNRASVREEQLIDEIALSQSRSLFQLMVDMRSWAALQGGVYVPVSEYTPSNPYLEHPRRDVVTKDGVNLTLVNPAYMTRQVSEVGLKRRGVQVRITSLNPIRPENAPVKWETAALETFEGGEPHYYELYQDDGMDYHFRYMQPLMLESACLNCHNDSDPAVSQIRGGISVVFPVDELVRNRRSILRLNKITYASIWLVGMFVIAGLLLILEQIYGSPFRRRL